MIKQPRWHFAERTEPIARPLLRFPFIAAAVTILTFGIVFRFI